MTPIFTKGEIVNKAWGYEEIIHNDADYCGKILHFYKDKKFSVHMHLLKRETWRIVSGKFMLTFIDTDTAKKASIEVGPGNVIHLERGVPHQLHALEEGEVFEVSTTHYDSDSYRIEPGDSQV